MKRRRGTFVALLLSAVAFSFFHVPVLYKSQVGSSEFISFLLGAFAAGVFYGAVYWLTDWNLSISVFLHFFYDAYAVTLNGSQLDPLWTYRINIDFVVLPSIAVIVVHQIVKWQKRARQQKAEPSQEES